MAIEWSFIIFLNANGNLNLNGQHTEMDPFHIEMCIEF